MNSFDVADLKENTYFTKEVVLDKTFLLLNTAIPVTSSLIKALLDWDFRQVYSDGTVGDGIAKNEFQPVTLTDKKTTDGQISADGSTSKSFTGGIGDAVKKVLEDAEFSVLQDTADSEANRLSIVQKVYNEYLNYISAVYTHYATHKELNLEEISATVKDFCVFIKENRRYVLRIQPSLEARNKNFLVSHSMRSTVLAITIGLQIRMPLSKLVELGVACILHEIGMIRLPPQLYLNNKPLSASERNILFTHPVIAYNIVKGFDFPLTICLGILEHHEKENGTGYPRHIEGSKISLYAKIISVACSFEAITAPRFYKEAKSTYEAMVEMLRNTSHQYDDTIIKALLYSLSFFPIGAYVYLSNGKLGQVIDANPESPKNPIVQIFGETNQDGSPMTIQTNDTGIKIVRVLNKQETDDLLKQNSAKSE